jgi:hypothetical protein
MPYERGKHHMTTTFQSNKHVTQEKRDELQKSLQAGAQELLEELRQGKSARLQELITFSAKFYRYSPLNQRLIQRQCRARGIDAEYVASFTDWKARNYSVKKGEHGIAIYQPRPYREKDPETGEEKEKLYFKIAYVFANTQVTPMRPDLPPLPTFFTGLQGDCEALYTRLAEIIKAEGIRLVEEEKICGQGYSAKGTIGLKKGLDSTNRFLTLIHEYAHELLHAGSTLGKQVKECQAEAVSFIVAYHFGIKNPFSSDYLQTWGNDEKSLTEELDVVQRTAATIIKKMEDGRDGPDALTPARPPQWQNGKHRMPSASIA